MSLNKTLDRLFDEIRREAKRNPDFADRMDAVLRGHVSRRDVADDVLEEVSSPLSQPAADSSPVNGGAKSSTSFPPPRAGEVVAERPEGGARAPSFNPVGLYQRDGEDTLKALLGALDHAALMALIAEHHLDPVGAASGLEGQALADFIVAQAKKRVERDKKLFDY